MKCIGNYLKERAAIARNAIIESGLAIEWHDEPDEKMTFDRDKFGSLWALDNLDCTKFWRAYERLATSEQESK